MDTRTDPTDSLIAMMMAWVAQAASLVSRKRVKQWGSRTIIPVGFVLLTAVTPAAADEHRVAACDTEAMGAIAYYGDLGLTILMTIAIIALAVLVLISRLTTNPEKSANRKARAWQLAISIGVVTVVFPTLTNVLGDETALACFDLLPF